jgi:uncharacterized protein YqhQ
VIPALAAGPLIGGQAVIEGVMMRAPRSLAVAVRRPAGDVVVLREHLQLLGDRHPFLRYPFLRGTPAIVEALSHGIRALNFSAAQAVDEADAAPTPAGLAVATAVALAAGIGLFFLLPLVVTQLIGRYVPGLGSGFLFNLVDGLIRLLVFFGYVVAIASWGEIRRVFEYHGAEHMAVAAYEHGEELTVSNARRHSPLHPRCGTNFLLIVMAVSVLVFSLLPGPWPLGLKFLARLVLIPVVAGTAYEIVRVGALESRRGTAWIRTPGLWLQRLTTRPPSDSQIEVALRALGEVLAMERGECGVHQAG